MLVNELRNLLKKYNENEKDTIIVELYKRIPKRVKEDYDIDNYISNISDNAGKVKKQETVLSIEKLEAQINYFVECASADLYASPNKVIPKAERSKWRFLVKSYYKQLNKFPSTTKDGIIATKLLKDLFEILSYGTHYLTFSSWNTFGAIQVLQSDFLHNIVKRTLSNGMTIENISFCTDLLTVYFDPQEFSENNIIAFTSALNNADVRYTAIDLLKEKIHIWNEKYKNSGRYEVLDTTNTLVLCVLYLYFDLCETKAGIKFFKSNYSGYGKEYKLLDILENYKLYDIWIKEYESHMRKLEGYNDLKEKYEKFKKSP